MKKNAGNFTVHGAPDDDHDRLRNLPGLCGPGTCGEPALRRAGRQPA